MKLSTKGRYAVMAMADLARMGAEGPVTLSDIASRQEISLSYLEQLFAKLRRAGLVKSVRGPGGGYRLARHHFGEPFGSLRPGAPADFIILDNFQKTPLTSGTWLSHLLYDFHPWDIGSVWVGGRRVYNNGDGPPVAPKQLQETAMRLWRTMGWV